MQRRLFLLFVSFSLIPVVVILVVNWQIGQRNLDFLDSPGLSQAMDGSVGLAQERLTARPPPQATFDFDQGAGLVEWPDMDQTAGTSDDTWE